ncbi:hypothetical protein AKO1_007981 [Acrasis kona]|uniref:Rho-GAP domain-containing protein n=1 Tax=Acrasis kona TaxID=1008807 RepID=A0AAW2YQJ6_9EUKA
MNKRFSMAFRPKSVRLTPVTSHSYTAPTHLSASAAPVSNCLNELSLFGVPLEVSLSRGPDKANGTVPIALYNAIEFINEFNLEEEGLYRIPGNKRIMDQYKQEFDAGIPIDFVKDHTSRSRIHECHDVCGLIRQFMTCLPETIFTFELATSFQLKEFGNDPNNMDELDLKINRLKDLCDRLPTANRDTLKMFVKHLNLITKHSAVNLMTAKNLVISLFGMAIHNRTYFLMIQHADRIFAEDDTEHTEPSTPHLIIPDEPIITEVDATPLTSESNLTTITPSSTISEQQSPMPSSEPKIEAPQTPLKKRRFTAFKRASEMFSSTLNKVMKKFEKKK